jgi:hypothetical protein
MKKPSRLAIVFNGAALLIVLASATAVLRSVFVADELALCSTRYGQGTQLSLERSPGELLTSADLQARFGGTDWGLLDNARVVEIKDNGPRPAIEVRLAKVPAEAAPDNHRAGMGFTWTPRGVHGVSSACLTYSLLMPSDFDFAKGGRLPGLQANAQAQTTAAHVPSIRAGWREAGGLEVSAQLAGWSDARPLANDRRDYPLPRGQWVALEQEIVLNTPGQKDGVVRVWADGALRFEKTGLALRDSADVRITGVAAEALSYGAVPSRERKLWFSPLELRWQ